MIMHHIIVNLLQATNDKHLVESYNYSPENNALTIIDFDVGEKEHFRGTGTVTAVLPRIVALNFQIIEPKFTSAIDFAP